MMILTEPFSLIIIHNEDRQVSVNITQLAQFAEESICVYKERLSHQIPGVLSISYSHGAELTHTLNRAYQHTTGRSVLIMYSDEEIVNPVNVQLFLKSDSFAIASVKSAHSKGNGNFDIRIIPRIKSESEPFKGSVLPDLSHFVHKYKLEVSSQVLLINKESAFMDVKQLEALIKYDKALTPMDWFWAGIYYSEKQNYRKAEKALKECLKSDAMPQFNRIAALNHLANTLVEQQKKEEALNISKQSLELQPQQFTPYLIIHKVHWFKREWEQAAEPLKTYLDIAGKESLANFDIYFDPAEAHLILAEISLLIKNRESAFTHYETFYQLKDGFVADRIKDKIFIYAVELNLKKKAVHYFNEFYAGRIKKKMSNELRAHVLGAISLFEDKGWNQEACEFYEKLFKTDPKSQKVMRRLLITLMRSDQIAKARQTVELANF